MKPKMFIQEKTLNYKIYTDAVRKKAAGETLTKEEMEAIRLERKFRAEIEIRRAVLEEEVSGEETTYSGGDAVISVYGKNVTISEPVAKAMTEKLKTDLSDENIKGYISFLYEENEIACIPENVLSEDVEFLMKVELDQKKIEF